MDPGSELEVGPPLSVYTQLPGPENDASSANFRNFVINPVGSCILMRRTLVLLFDHRIDLVIFF